LVQETKPATDRAIFTVRGRSQFPVGIGIQ